MILDVHFRGSSCSPGEIAEPAKEVRCKRDSSKQIARNNPRTTGRDVHRPGFCPPLVREVDDPLPESSCILLEVGYLVLERRDLAVTMLPKT